MKNSILALIVFASSASCFASLDAHTAQSMNRSGVTALSLNRWGGPAKGKSVSMLHLELEGGFGCTFSAQKNFETGLRTGQITVRNGNNSKKITSPMAQLTNENTILDMVEGANGILLKDAYAENGAAPIYLGLNTPEGEIFLPRLVQFLGSGSGLSMLKRACALSK